MVFRDFEDFDEIMKGHQQRVMHIYLMILLAFIPEREYEIIEVFELAKKQSLKPQMFLTEILLRHS